MLAGTLTALLLLLTLLSEAAFFSTLPLPWRLLPLGLILGLALIHRVSFELGGAFLLAASVAAYISGLTPFTGLVTMALLILAAYGLSTRIFASRSLVAFTGFAFSVGLIYLFVKFAIFSPVPGFFPWMYLFCVSMTALLALLASIALNFCLSLFSRRFVRKTDIYEIRAERS